jgi:hypothetical protein
VEIYKGRAVFYGMGVYFIKGEIKALQETIFRVFPDAKGRPPTPKPPERSVRPGGNPASWYDGVVVFRIWPTTPTPAASWKPCRRTPRSSVPGSPSKVRSVSFGFRKPRFLRSRLRMGRWMKSRLPSRDRRKRRKLYLSWRR